MSIGSIHHGNPTMPHDRDIYQAISFLRLAQSNVDQDDEDSRSQLSQMIENLLKNDVKSYPILEPVIPDLQRYLKEPRSEIRSIALDQIENALAPFEKPLY